ncbi:MULTISPECIES: cation-translocating P-type ATPase [Ramlibacter]|uniref:Cation-translocating P-type ATPase n=1 Tax=Ramlibacter aquaticus TaxID=2780094 RepID=A0ABR9SJZ7_9BURK|nr:MULTISPECIES: cation-translocating P-type ATPase [Ramlibacter]MBE7942575.1 cation-translocating P-type ATPase [Ramlibacter aquaticus]
MTETRAAAANLQGLTAGEAARRLREQGPNEIEAREGRGWWLTLRGIASEPMFVLLLAAAAVYLVVGDLGEGLLLSAFALLTVGLVIFQERRSENALRALRALGAPQARVLRDGRVQRIPARELVVGDLFLLGEGERVPADALLREAASLTLDESLLTGESVPVRKRAEAGALPATAPPAGGEDMPFVYAGTLVVAGHGVAQACAIGAATRVGAIGRSLADIEGAPTPLQRSLKKLVALLGLGAVALSALLALWWGLVRGQWLQGLLSGIASGMAMLPEEFPMALSVFLALGAWRLAQARVLARRPAVIEALGGTTVLCVDKTGTLTENRMRLRRVATAALDFDLAPLAPDAPLPEAVHALLEFGMLASRRSGVEPMDNAILARGDAAFPGTDHLHPDWLIAQEYPLTPELLAVTQAWTDGAGLRTVAAKGAPEAVLDLCHLPPGDVARVMERVAGLAAQGLRVIAVARGSTPAGAAPDRAHDHDFEFLGLLGFEDPLRATVPAAIAQAHGAGIAVAMITGDHAATALAIAREAGIAVDGGVLTGAELAAMDDARLAQAVRTVRVFARVTPEQKLRLVQAFQADGEVVAMTGDGVNDAPALKAAHIGIAMGVRGTDVAREAAALVLLDEDFDRIVAAVRLGRRIFDNLRRVMGYITAIHVPIVGLALLPVFLGLPPLMLPAHVVLTQMVIDPLCSLAFEGAPEAPGLMRRPPRPAGQGLVGWPMLRRGAVQGGLLLLGILALYAFTLHGGGSVALARTQAMVALTVGNLGLVWLNASQGAGWRAVLGPGYRAFWAVGGLALGAFTLALALPGGRALLGFTLPDAAQLALAVASAVASVLLAALAMRWVRS